MRNFLHILWFEMGNRWLSALLPVAYVLVFPILQSRGDSQTSLWPSAGFSLLFQLPILAAPIFQNTFWGRKDIRFTRLEFVLTRAVSRTKVFFAKAAIYLFLCSSISLSCLIFSAFQPAATVTIREKSGSNRVQELSAFYAESFPGSAVRNSEKSSGAHLIDIPQGRVASACTLLVVSLVYGALFQLLLALIPEEKMLMFWLLTIGILVLWALFSLAPFIFGWERPVVSSYERFVAFIWGSPLLAAAALALSVGAIEFICCRRFAQKEVI